MRTILFLLLSFQLFALDHHSPETLFHHMYEVNKEWGKHILPDMKEEISFSTDLDRIQKHLFLVVELLQKNSADFSGKTLANRKKLLVELTNYATKKVFPVNLYHANRQPYFIDHLGTHCAVGYLMLRSGYGKLAKAISRKENYAYVREIKTEGVIAWASEFGFTLDELALIQPGYQAPTYCENLQGATNGEVKELIADVDEYLPYEANKIYISGNFTELNQLPCLNLGRYDGFNLSCLGAGIEGVVNEIKPIATGVVAVGYFLSDGLNYPIAVFSNSTNEWTFFQLPNKTKIVGNAVNTIYSHLSISAVQYFSLYDSITQKHEIWEHESSTWSKLAESDGIISEIEFYSNTQKILGGKFQNISVFDNLGNQTSTLSGCTNMVVLNPVDNLFSTEINGSVCDSVIDIKVKGEVIYIAGDCQSANTAPCLTRYLNGVFQPLILGTDLYEWDNAKFINRVELNPATSQLVLGGNFMSTGWEYGINLAELNLASGVLTPLASFNKPVDDFIFFRDQFIVGGNFYGFNFQADTNYNYLVSMSQSYSGIKDIATDKKFDIFPNPSTSFFQISGLTKEVEYCITDMTGRPIQKGKTHNSGIDVSNLNSSSYLLEFEAENYLIRTKFIKN